MKNLLLTAFLFASIISFAQSKPDSVKSEKKIDYTLHSDTSHVIIPAIFFEEIRQIEEAIKQIQSLEKRKNEIYGDILKYNERKTKGRTFKTLNWNIIVFEKIDTIRNSVKPELKKKK